MSNSSNSRDASHGPTIETVIVGTFGCLLKEHSSLYCAVPITSGLRLWRLANATGIKHLDEVKTKLPLRFASEVLEPNIVDANSFANAARKLNGNAIDPSRLTVPSWNQEQYNALWEMVIDKWVRAVILSPDWVFSKGCVSECMFAMKGSIEILDSTGTPMSQKGFNLVLDKALSLRDELSIEAPFLDDLSKILRTSHVIR